MTQPDPVPADGYAVPTIASPISLDYHGWWRRSLAIVAEGWPLLAALQAFGAAIGIAATVPVLLSGRTAAGLLVTNLVSALTAMACVHVTVSIAVGARPQPGRALLTAGRRALPLIWWQLLATVLTLLTAIVGLIPALYPLLVFTILPVVVLLERANALDRCVKLFNPNFGAAAARAGTVAGINLVTLVLGLLIGQLLQTALAGSGRLTAVVVGTGVAHLLIGASAVLTTPMTLTAYVDLRSRVEPVSAETLARTIGVTDS